MLSLNIVILLAEASFNLIMMHSQYTEAAMRLGDASVFGLWLLIQPDRIDADRLLQIRITESINAIKDPDLVGSVE